MCAIPGIFRCRSPPSRVCVAWWLRNGIMPTTTGGVGYSRVRIDSKVWRETRRAGRAPQQTDLFGACDSQTAKSYWNSVLYAK